MAPALIAGKAEALASISTRALAAPTLRAAREESAQIKTAKLASNHFVAAAQWAAPLFQNR